MEFVNAWLDFLACGGRVRNCSSIDLNRLIWPIFRPACGVPRLCGHLVLIFAVVVSHVTAFFIETHTDTMHKQQYIAETYVFTMLNYIYMI